MENLSFGFQAVKLLFESITLEMYGINSHTKEFWSIIPKYWRTALVHLIASLDT